MKELIEFLGAYPTWVKVFVTVLGAIIVLILILFRQDPEKDTLVSQGNESQENIEATARRFIDQPHHWRFIESLPEFRATAYREAHKGWDTGITAEMVQANYDLVDFLKDSWVRLSDFYPPGHFNGKNARNYIDEYIEDRFSYHRNRYEVEGTGTAGTIVSVMAGGNVIADLEKMISETINGISLYVDKFEYLEWKNRWEEDYNK